MEKLLYAILLANNDPNTLTRLVFGARGISGMQTNAVSSGDITAIVGEVSRAGFLPDKAAAINYARVIDYLFPHYPLLPMRYGSILDSDDAVQSMLDRNSEGLRHNLGQVEGMAEFGLKVICNPEILKDELRQREENVAELPVAAAGSVGSSVFREYVEKKLRQHRLDEQATAHSETVMAEITDRLTGINARLKFKKMAMAALMVDAVILIDRRYQEDLVKTVADLQNRSGSLKFVLTGPWPPYSFVEITIK